MFLSRIVCPLKMRVKSLRSLALPVIALLAGASLTGWFALVPVASAASYQGEFSGPAHAPKTLSATMGFGNWQLTGRVSDSVPVFGGRACGGGMVPAGASWLRPRSIRCNVIDVCRRLQVGAAGGASWLRD